MLAKQGRLLVLLVMFCIGGRVFGANMGSIQIQGNEQINSSTGTWDAGYITVSINGYSKTVSYGQFSTPGSIASAIAALFSSDCYGPANAKSTADGTIYIKGRNGVDLSQLSIDNHSSISFSGSTNSSVSPTSITATIGVMQLLLGQSTNVDVQVSCNSACGQVSYLVDGVQWTTLNLDGNGHASAQTSSNLPSGLHNVVVKFVSGGAYMAATSNPVSFVISSNSTPTNPTGIYGYNISSYTANGNVQAYSDSVNGTWSNIGYDGLNRLTSAQYGTQYLCWSYDSFGNRLAQALSNSPCNNPTPSVSYNANNQIQGLQYDAAGNVTDNDRYLYDAEGKLCAVKFQALTGGPQTMMGYIYDAEGRRVAKGTISQWSCDMDNNGFSEQAGYVLGSNGEQVTETDGQGNWVHTNVFSNGELIATYTPSGLSVHLNDWLGTRRMDTDVSGNPGPSYQSMPFGELSNPAQTISPPEHFFTGKERDIESGLDYFGARYYSSAVGRLMSPDPLMTSAKVWDPQTWNRYAYARNNPLSYIDPTGMAEVKAADCAKDKACVTVNVNVIYDKNANGGKGVTDSQKAGFEKNQLQNAKDQYGNADIHLNVTYTAGEINSKGNLTGVNKGALNVFVTDSGGPASFDTGGYAVSRINVNSTNNEDLPHEMAHQFMGDMSSALGRTLSQDPTGISRIIDNMFTDVTNDTGRAIMNNVTPHLPNYANGQPASVFNPQARDFQNRITPQTHP